MVAKETRGRYPEAILNNLETDQNAYFFVRFLETFSVLDYLQRKGVLRRENFEGRVVDLGTGSGISLLTLRQFSPQGELIGVDNQNAWRDTRNRYAGCFYKIPQIQIVEAALAKFERFNILDFVDLYRLSGEQASLVTGFYTFLPHWPAGSGRKLITGFDYDEAISLVFEEIGGILPPRGQLVITSDWRPNRPSWAREEFVLTGTKGPLGRTLILPFPEWLRDRFWGFICEEGSKLFSRLRFFFEDEIFETMGDEIGLIRDMKVCVFTK